MQVLPVRTSVNQEFVEITSAIQDIVQQSGVANGRADIFIPHTTAAITINENADPDVVHDMLLDLNRLVPTRSAYYRHFEGNSASHMKASMMGFHMTVFILDGRLQLGTWQGIYFCEFDGPRNRKAFVSVCSA